MTHTPCSPEDYYGKNVAILFLDHLKEQMHTRFSEDDKVGSSIFSLVPVNLLKLKSSLQDIASQLKF